MADGSLIWWSERSGHGHLYHYVDGKFVALTSGPWEVTGLVGVDEAKGRLYFTANRNTPIEQQRYAIDIARPNQLDRKSVVSGKSVSVRVDLGGRLIIKKKKTIAMKCKYKKTITT